MNSTLPAPATQRQFGFAAVEKHSLARLDTVMYLLEVNELAVFDLIADGELAGFNLAGPGADRRLPSVWSKSLREYAERQVQGSKFKVQSPSDAEIVADILPPGHRDLHFREVLRALGIKRRLLHDLLDAKLLSAVAGTGDKVSKAPMIKRASVVTFLTGRRM